MRIHSSAKIRKLKTLRKRGYSIGELVSELSIPKTTVWHHVHGIRIPRKYIERLRRMQGGSAERKRKNLARAQLHARTILEGPNREAAIALAMLYWSEGSKKACEFINSDGKMIVVYLKILRNVLDVPENVIRPTMRIFSGMDQSECLSHWSNVTGIPKKKFLIRFNDGGTRGKTRYGMCRITVMKGQYFLKVMHALMNMSSETMFWKT